VIEECERRFEHEERSKLRYMFKKNDTVAIVVSPQYDEDVFDHRYEEDGVDDKGQDTQNIIVMLDSIVEGAGIYVKG